MDSTNGELSDNIDRPVTESVTARSEMDTVFPSNEHSELVGRPVTTDGQMNLGDTPPSSDLGIYSLEEQWENMSISVVDLESEQNERPTSGSPTGRRGSDLTRSESVHKARCTVHGGAYFSMQAVFDIHGASWPLRRCSKKS